MSLRLQVLLHLSVSCSKACELCCAVPCCVCCVEQRTQAGCRFPDNVMILPFDLMDSTDKLQAAAKAADEAFGGAGIDFLIHNAGGQHR